jgi:hypothetical protein
MCVPIAIAGIAAAAAAGGGAAAAGVSTMAALSLAATAASGVMAAGGAVAQGRAQKKQAAYQAQVERNNAQIATWQAADAVQRGRIEEQNQRLKVARIAGSQRAGFASSGVELGSGSPLDVLMDTAQLGELDALTIRSNAEREAYGYTTQSSNLTAQSGLTRMAGRNAQTAGYISAGSTLLSTAGTAADRYGTYKRLGMIG